jgi:hypothetical protein
VPRRNKNPLLIGRTCREKLFPDQVNGTIRSQNQWVTNGLTIVMKHIKQHLT